MPLQSGFVVIGLEAAPGGRECGILGRVIRDYPQGDLLSGPGEEYLVDIMGLNQQVPEQVRHSRFRYRMSVCLLGQMVEEARGRIQFASSVRMMPHVGASVGFPTDEVYAMIARGTCRADDSDPTMAPVIGHLAFSDLVFDGNERNARGRTFPVRFGIEVLFGRRSAVFARASIGKANFVKVLLALLAESSGSGHRQGTLVLDPDGEYAFANASEPGLLDVPGVAEHTIVVTDRLDYDRRYAAAVKGGCRINFCELQPVETVAHAVVEERQKTVFANTLRGFDSGAWCRCSPSTASAPLPLT